MENKPINELNEVYDYLSSDDELYHHGVLGMKWGIRRYQPYSLIPRGSGKRGKEVGAAKKSKSTGSSSSSSKRTKKKSRKQTQDEIKAKKIKDLQTARQRSEEKQKILKSGDAKLIYENRDSFTRAQMEEAINRINTEKSLRSLVAEQNPSRSTKMKRTLSKVVNADNLQKTADLIEKGANLYNQTARVANVFRDDEHQLKYVGKAENKKVEKKLSKELQDILNSGDAQRILDNQSKFNDDQIKNAKQRLDNLQKINQQAKKAQEDSEKRSEKYRSEAFDAVDTYGEKYAREKLARDYGNDNANKLVDSVLTEKKISELDSQAAARYISKTKYDAVEEERRRKGLYQNGPSSSVVKHCDVSVDELTGVYDYLSSDDELYHHGVLGMKWGIRRYQSYDTVPRGSGKGGKEVREAKGSNSKIDYYKESLRNPSNFYELNNVHKNSRGDYVGRVSYSGNPGGRDVEVTIDKRVGLKKGTAKLNDYLMTGEQQILNKMWSDKAKHNNLETAYTQMYDNPDDPSTAHSFDKAEYITNTRARYIIIRDKVVDDNTGKYIYDVSVAYQGPHISTGNHSDYDPEAINQPYFAGYDTKTKTVAFSEDGLGLHDKNMIARSKSKDK